MSVECPHCHALHFSRKAHQIFKHQAQVWHMLSPRPDSAANLFPEPPQLLRQLLTRSTPKARKFRRVFASTTALFAFTSVAVKVDDTILNGALTGGARTGPYSFKMHGGLYHSMGTLHPQEGRRPSYAQLYIYDEQAALAARNIRNPNLDHTLMADLQNMFIANNPLVPLYSRPYQIMQ